MKKKTSPKTVKASELSTIRMTTGGEKKHSVVIHEGVVKEWVGMGWIDVRIATKIDRKKYPTVKG